MHKRGMIHSSTTQPGDDQMTQAMKYKLNAKSDIDTDEPGVYILNLQKGWRFDEASIPNDRSHVKGFDTMRELRDAIKNEVIQCDCWQCK
jgi:hypothetical protein